jgi:hypothetical protein
MILHGKDKVFKQNALVHALRSQNTPASCLTLNHTPFPTHIPTTFLTSTMVFTIAQTTAFFTAPDQMGLEARTRVHLQSEGIVNVEDLAEFKDDDDWKQVIENCRKPPKIPDANGVLQEQEAFRIGAKSLHRLKVAAKAVRYYQGTDRPLSAANMQWTVLKNFESQWDGILHMKDDDSELPKMSKSVGIVKWLEAYDSYAHSKLGVRLAPLAYVIRDDANVDAPPVLATDEPHSDVHGSIKGEMVARFSHNHGLFREDNAAVFDDIEEAMRGSKFAASIAPFKRAKNGRAAYMALKEQHAGRAMWDEEARKCKDFLLNRKFTGGTSTTLDRFMAQHRQAFVTMQRCAENIQVELPNERTRVGYLIDNIEVSDAEVRAAISSIKLDDSPTGLREDFERAVAFLLPLDPVAKKSKGKRAQAEISDTELKQSRGPKTGVDLRYYKLAEWKKLSDEERAEVRELREQKNSKRAKTGGKGNRGSPQTSVSAKFRASLVKAVTKEIREEEEKQRTAIDAIAGILKSTGAVSAAAGDEGSSKGGTKRVQIKEDKESEDGGAVVAATKLYGMIKTMSNTGNTTRKGGKGKSGST